MAVDISRYEKFLEVRNNAMKIIEKYSIHCELKSNDDDVTKYSSPANGDTENCAQKESSLGGNQENEECENTEKTKIRHVGVITQANDIVELERLISEWDRMARELIAADPIRFPKTAFVLAPIPQVIYGVKAMSIAVGDATTSKKYTKQSMLGRYDRAIRQAKRAERVSNNKALLRQLERERALLAEDDETHYRVRNTCGTETICTLTFKDGTTDKVRVPHVGVAFADLNGSLEIRQPRIMSPRSDRVELLGVDPLDCSLSGLAGFVYRESELIRARAKYQLSQARNNK